MRPEDRNFNETGYKEDRSEERNRDRRYPEDRDMGYGQGMSGQQYDRSYDRGGFNRERFINRDYEPNRVYNRGPIGYGGTDYDQDLNYNRYGARNIGESYRGEQEQGRGGHFHSTETDQPGRGYENEWDMNRNANDYRTEARNRGWGRNERRDQNPRGYDQNNRYGVASSHTASGPYEDYERDVDRYGLREDYERRGGQYPQDRRSGYGSRRGETGEYDYEQGYRERDRQGSLYEREGRQGGYGYGYEQQRAREQNFSTYYRNNEEAERRRRLSERIQDRGLERSRSGNWGPSEYPYQAGERYRENY